MRSRFSPKARQELLAIVSYIAEDDPAAALRFRDRVRHALDVVSRFPEAGRVVPEGGCGEIREVIVAPYRLLYRRDGDVLLVVSLWHGARRSPLGPDGSLR